MSRTLSVFLHDKQAGMLIQSDEGSLSFVYAANYLSGANRPAISVSMPLQEEAYEDNIARPYFSGLLPDERARRRLASVLGISDGNAFGLLEIIGGECAGALSLLPQGTMPPDHSTTHIKPLGAQQLEATLKLLRSRPLLGGEEGVRLSLAGAQDKLAVCLVDGQVALAEDGRPTTHILKPFIEGLNGSVENELFCMKLAKRIGLEAPDTSIASAGEIDFILVKRYDRIQRDDKTILRLHQEDFCQALSVPPELKYEEEGGPSVTQSQELIQENARQPAADRLSFQHMLIFHYLVGNADAHAKNYALLYRENAPDLAPLYDVVCTAAYPNLAKNMAMKIGGRAIADTIQLEHWLSLVPNTKAAHQLMTKDMKNMAETIEAKADELLKELADQEITHPILKKIRNIISTRATHLLRITDA